MTAVPEASPAVLLDIQHLNVWYGAAQALFDVALQVRRGEVVALMGRNGAGKSTLLKAIMGLIRQHHAQIQFMGRDISRQPSYRIAQLGMGYVPEDRRIFTELTVMQNLDIGCQPPRQWPDDGVALPPWTLQRILAVFPNLSKMLDRSAAHMSGGEQQMLTVARTLMGNPYLVLLDEPSEGIAPIVVEQMVQAVQTLKAQGAGVLLSEQNLHFADTVADRVYVLEEGHICYQGTMAVLVENNQVLRAHMTI